MEAALYSNWCLCVYANNIAAKKLYSKLGMVCEDSHPSLLTVDGDKKRHWILRELGAAGPPPSPLLKGKPRAAGGGRRGGRKNGLETDESEEEAEWSSPTDTKKKESWEEPDLETDEAAGGGAGGRPEQVKLAVMWDDFVRKRLYTPAEADNIFCEIAANLPPASDKCGFLTETGFRAGCCGRAEGATAGPAGAPQARGRASRPRSTWRCSPRSMPPARLPCS